MCRLLNKSTRYSVFSLESPFSSGPLLERKLVQTAWHGTMWLQTLFPQHLHSHLCAGLQTFAIFQGCHLHSTKHKQLMWIKNKCIDYFVIFLHDHLPMQIQCGRYTSNNFPEITVMSIRGPAGMYFILSILFMGSSEEQNWYLKLTFSWQTQRKPETLHSKFPASDFRLKYNEKNTEFVFGTQCSINSIGEIFVADVLSVKKSQDRSFSVYYIFSLIICSI